jgi:hypothetical protein
MKTRCAVPHIGNYLFERLGSASFMIRLDRPRRYVLNADGDHVLVGLTIIETRELEGLEALTLADKLAAQYSLIEAREHRWAELYEKHNQAWRIWMAKGHSAFG